MNWTRVAGPLEWVSKLESRSLGVPFYHAARGRVCFCGCGHVGNADALSIMSTAPAAPATASARPPSACGSQAPNEDAIRLEGEPFSNAARNLPAVGVALEIDVLVLQRAPQPLDERYDGGTVKTDQPDTV